MEQQLTVADLARKANVDFGNLRNALAGDIRMSANVAKSVAGVLQVNPAVLYVEAGARSIKSHAEAGDLGAVHKGIGAIFGQLATFAPKEIETGGADLAEAISSLTAILTEAQANSGLTFGAPADAQDAPEKATLSDKVIRDARAVIARYEKKANAPTRDSFGVRIKAGPGNERDGYGRSTGSKIKPDEITPGQHFNGPGSN